LVLGPSNDALGVLIDTNRIEAGDSPATSGGVTMRTFQNKPVVELTNNWIKGGAGSWTRAVNAFNSAPGTIIADNEMFAGDQVGNNNGTSFAMIISGEAVVDGNRINHDPVETGACVAPAPWYWCGGIESEGSTVDFTNNVVYGMEAPKSVGIFIAEGEVPFGYVLMANNTIDGGGLDAGQNISAALACRTSQGQNAQIGDFSNNILTGGAGTNSFGFYEDDQTNGRTCEPTSYDNNAIYDVDNAHRQWAAGGFAVLLPSVAAVNALGYASGNVDTDCELDATWHLGANSPCIDAGIMMNAPDHDFEGDDRPQGGGVDIGADERE
jgi:hypothetical protein